MRALLFLLLLLALVAGCDIEGPFAPPSPLRVTPPGLLITSDTFPCPQWVEYYGAQECTYATDTELNILRGEAQRILNHADGQCYDAGMAIWDALAEPVFVQHTPGIQESGGVRWDNSIGPPHPPEGLFVSYWMLWDSHVEEGNTLQLLYHEASHLLGIGTVEQYHDQSDVFADDCIEAFHVEKTLEEQSSSSGGSGEKPGDESDDVEICWVWVWRWKSTGEVAWYQVLSCG